MREFTSTKSRRQRRAEWETLQVKDMRARIRAAVDPQGRQNLGKELFTLRKMGAKAKDDAEVHRKARARKLSSGGKGDICPISLLVHEGGSCLAITTKDYFKDLVVVANPKTQWTRTSSSGRLNL